MAIVTGFTAARMLLMEAATVITGAVVGDSLILTTKGGASINAGDVRGPQGVQGPMGEVTQAQLNAAIANAHAEEAITANQLALNSVTNAKILNGAVTLAKMAVNSVAASQLTTGSVINAKIADGAVTLAKMAANSVSASQIINGSVTSVKIANGAVTSLTTADTAMDRGGGTISSSIRYRKHGVMVTVWTTAAQSLDGVLGTLPVGFRPNVNIFNYLRNASNVGYQLTVNTNGEVYSSATGATFNVTFSTI